MFGAAAHIEDGGEPDQSGIKKRRYQFFKVPAEVRVRHATGSKILRYY